MLVSLSLQRRPHWFTPGVAFCEVMDEVRVRVRDAGVSGSLEAVLRFFRFRYLLVARAEEVL